MSALSAFGDGAFLSLGESSDIFTSALYNFYQAPAGFCFDIECDDEPIIDNPKSFDYNVPERVGKFVEFLKKQQKAYRTNNIILTMGGDFNYQAAHVYFKNTDKLIRYTNEAHPELNVFYSTPSCYAKSVNEANLSFETKQDDFFPYANDPNSYWTGYFTSRPTLKYFERQSNTLLQVAKQLTSLNGGSSDDLEALQSAMGVMQHHDAITGTEKQAVAEDYARLLDKAVVQTEGVVADALSQIISKPNAPALELESCRLRNISECALSSESNAFLVTIYNPLSRPVDYYVRLPVENATYTVSAPDGSDVLTQTLPVPEHLSRIPGRSSTTQRELVFKAPALPPLGYRSYYVSRSNVRDEMNSRVWVPAKGEGVSIGDEVTKITLDPQTKFLKSISNRAETYDVAQSLQIYNGHDGDNNGSENRASGAYVFRPADNNPHKITDEAETVVIQGEVVDEVHQVFSDWATQIIRHYSDQPVVEFEWLVGPIPVDDNVGKEIISKFTTSIPTYNTFYTDTNGREEHQRKKDYRATWDLDVHEPVSGNYYPIVSHISFDNSTAGLAIVTDRPQGGSSLEDGSLELMVHRRLLHDDAYGAGEALNEQAYGQGLVARGRHFVLIGDTTTTVSPQEIRILELRKYLDGLVLLSDVSGQSQQQVANNYNLEFTAIANPLPEQVNILTLEPWKGNSLLLRLENIFSKDQNPDSVTVDITNLFANLEVTSARETTLSALKWLDEATRLQWQKDSNEIPTGSPRSKVPLAVDAIELAPTEIRTFVIEVAAK